VARAHSVRLGAKVGLFQKDGRSLEGGEGMEDFRGVGGIYWYHSEQCIYLTLAATVDASILRFVSASSASIIEFLLCEFCSAHEQCSMRSSRVTTFQPLLGSSP
jgi:hypothetical protein